MPKTLPFNPIYLRRAVEAQVPRKALRDLWYMLRYGRFAPWSDEAIFVAPREVLHALVTPPRDMRFRRQNSGGVVPGDWDLRREDIEGNIKLQSCRMRWQQGAEWPETPIYQRLVREIAAGKRPDGCATLAEVNARYALLDEVFAATRFLGRLLTKDELPDQFRREHGGVLLHVARDGTCLRSGGGAHRFAIAKILDLPEMPGQIGAVHPGALENGHLARLRQSLFPRGAATGG